MQHLPGFLCLISWICPNQIMLGLSPLSQFFVANEDYLYIVYRDPPDPKMCPQSSSWSLESCKRAGPNPTAGAAGGTQARGSAALSSGGVVPLFFLRTCLGKQAT